MGDGDSQSYAAAFERSTQDPERFWREAAKALRWFEAPRTVLDADDAPFYRWFPDGTLNTCFEALDRHVEDGHGDQLALVHDSAMQGGPDGPRVTRRTYRELRDEVALFAGALAKLGLTKGDRVIVYMPMVPEAVVAMLACARLGAIHSVVFGGFAAHELATRIDDASPKLVIAASCGLEPSRTVAYKPLLDAALDEASHAVDTCVILQRPELEASLVAGRDVLWEDALAGAEAHAPVPVESTHPLYVLYTSGTTGQPKGVVRDHGGHAVALSWSMKNVYGAEPGDVYWAASDVGWVVGHSYIVYGPLLHRCTTVMYEGKPVGTPDAGAFWRVLEDHRVNVFFTAPTAFRAIKRVDPEGVRVKDYDTSALRTLFLAGERCDPDTLAWSGRVLGVPVVDHWWQTETGWPIASNLVGLEPMPVKPGSATVPVPGWDLQVLDDEGVRQPADVIGNLVAKLPLPPGALLSLWNADARYVETYLSRFEGYYATSDAGFIDADGYVHVMARTDDVINVAGHRLSTGALEEVIAAHPDVAECAVIGVQDQTKGQLPWGLLVLNAGCERGDDVVREAVAEVRAKVGPVAAFKHAVVVDKLPKTRSGKVLRGTLRKMADGMPWTMPATIEDEAVLYDVEKVIRAL
ncbi:MAG: propionyl-CoA synthetase [Myxococcota bacterium]